MRVVYDVSYDELFRKAEGVLGLTENSIQNLASYYEHIDELLEQSPEFLRVPLNEDTFIINTSDRSIKLPTDIKDKKWIVGVKDDHMAEVLFFKVDRFFDGQDLAICFPRKGNGADIPSDYKGQTYISWKNGPLNGLDAVTYVEIQEDVIYFGWVLTSGRDGNPNGGPLSRSGVLTFSVVFLYQASANENEPDMGSQTLFSFNTSSVDCTISENLIQSMSENITSIADLNVEDISSQPLVRPRFSGIFNNVLGPKPRITKELPAWENLTDGMVELSVEAAVSGDENNLFYVWTKNGSAIADAANNKTYVVIAEEGTDPTGEYTVEVGYRYAPDKVRYDESTCTIPGPQEIKFKDVTGNLISLGLADGNTPLRVEVETIVKKEYDKEPGEITYKWYREPLEGEQLEDITNPIAENVNTITPNDGDAGIYYVEVYNTKNTKTGNPIESNHAIMKARAETPSNVTLTKEENYIKANVDINHKNDLWYNWSYLSDTNDHSKDGSSGFIKGQDTYPIIGTGYYNCFVQQKIVELEELEGSSADPKGAEALYVKEV